MAIASVFFLVATGYFSASCMAQVELPVKPVNQAALVGNTVTLNCKSSSISLPDIRWQECITQSVEENCRTISVGTSKVYIENGGDSTRAARYSVQNPETGQYNLVVSGALSEDGGTYRCEAVARFSVIHYAEVILLDSEPDCYTSSGSNEALQGESVTWTCEVTYHGGWGPVMEWTKNGVDYDVTPQIAGTTITYSTTIEVQPTDDQTQFSVLTKFEAPSNPGEDTATNAPSYTHDFSFPALTVYFAPFDISTSPDQERISLGDTVTCYADANPAADYAWTNMNTSQVVSSAATLEITEDMLGQARFRCRAYNIHGEDGIEISIEVYGTTTITNVSSPPEQNRSTVLPWALFGAMSAFFLAAVAVNIYCWRKYRCAKNTESPRYDYIDSDLIRRPEQRPDLGHVHDVTRSEQRPDPDHDMAHESPTHDYINTDVTMSEQTPADLDYEMTDDVRGTGSAAYENTVLSGPYEQLGVREPVPVSTYDDVRH